MSNTLRHIAVLGGGSAGWLVAGLLAAEHGGASGPLRITVIESSEAPPIGVGEGTWPSMRDTLRRIGLSEVDLVRDCDATFKQGSRFDGWADGSPGEHYHHPFTLPTGYGEADLACAWLAAHADRPFAEVVCPQPQVCAAGLAPKQPATPQFAAVANYAYHFDAGKFGALLRRHAVGKLGVTHIVSHVDAVIPAADGGIAALRTRSAGDVEADLFIDCSGLPSLLIGQHHGVPLVEQRGVLFNDAALAMQVPYAQPDAPLASCTIATAWAKGWIWDIGLPHRRGVGAVYASRHASQDEAADALRQYLRATGAPADLPAMRPLAFTPGYRERFWVKNCVAIGLSAGFIEPLEASALALVELSAQWISEMLPAGRDAMPTLARRFNDVFSYRWARVIDFLKLHYALNRRADAPGSTYWHEHRDPASWPDSLREMLPLWRERPPSRLDFGRLDEVFPSASYQYVLYGMGFRPTSAASAAAVQAAAPHLQAAARLSQRMLSGLPPHRALIDHIARSGLPLI